MTTRLVAALCAATFGICAHAAEVLDQQSLDAAVAMASVGESRSVGATREQSFAVGVSGALSRIEFVLAGRFRSADDEPVLVRVVSGVNLSSAPTIGAGEIVHRRAQDQSRMGIGGFVAERDRGAPGETYKSRLSSAAPGLNHATWHRDTNGDHAGRRGFAFGDLNGNPTVDCAFKTYVDPPTAFTNSSPPVPLRTFND
jgi:hypothetical protein